MGGKHRRLIGGAELFADDSMTSFRAAALSLLQRTSPFTAKTLEAEQARLEERIARFGRCEDAVNIWTSLGAPDALSVPAMAYADFVDLADRLEISHHDAR
jgi:malonate decarboxylase beta subunit